MDAPKILYVLFVIVRTIWRTSPSLKLQIKEVSLE